MKDPMIKKINQIVKQRGRLNLSYSSISSLPDNLTVKGDLILNERFLELPKNLTVTGNLIIRNSHITHIPESTSIGGNLDITFTRIKEIPAICVGKNIIDVDNTVHPIITKNGMIKTRYNSEITRPVEMPATFTFGITRCSLTKIYDAYNEYLETENYD